MKDRVDKMERPLAGVGMEGRVDVGKLERHGGFWKGRGCEWVKSNTLKWFGHVERMGSEEFVKVYKSELGSPSRRGRPLGRWKDSVKEYLGERDLDMEWGQRRELNEERKGKKIQD